MPYHASKDLIISQSYRIISYHTSKYHIVSQPYRTVSYHTTPYGVRTTTVVRSREEKKKKKSGDQYRSDRFSQKKKQVADQPLSTSVPLLLLLPSPRGEPSKTTVISTLVPLSPPQPSSQVLENKNGFSKGAAMDTPTQHTVCRKAMRHLLG